MGKIAYIFPGQGSQSVGMGRELFESSPEARAVFNEADEALGSPISALCFEGPAERLALTENTQPAILTVSVAAYRAMRSKGYPAPDLVAGHSLGEYSALVAAGSLRFDEAVRLVRKRGLYMQDAVPVGEGAMAAVIGLGPEEVAETCRESAGDGVCSPANINSGKQIVIAGDRTSVEEACALLKEKGARKVISLNVSAPFHCDLMRPAGERLAKDLSALDFQDLEFPVIENVSAEPNLKGSRVEKALTEQVWSPVRWQETVHALVASGVDTFVEVGPGRVLSGLGRQIDRGVRSLNVSDTESLSNTLDKL